MATRTTAIGKISQNKRKENSVTEFVIGTGPVSVIFSPRSSHVQRSALAGLPFWSNSQGRCSTDMLSKRSCVALMMSFASIVSTTATAIIARSSLKSSPSKHPLSSVPSSSGCPLHAFVFLANLSSPGVGDPSFSYISPMMRSIVV